MIRSGLILSFLFFTLTITAQEQSVLSLDSVVSNFVQHFRQTPQEKIYLQTDKPYYISGEKIWFRVHLTDACLHYPVQMDKYVYTELINPSDSVVIRLKVRRENNIFQGHITLPEDLPEGNYRIRAYTNYMRNAGEDYFFTKYVFVGTPQTTFVQTAGQSDFEGKKGKKVPQSAFDVSFFPEGGYLVPDVPCKMAFKAIQSDGLHANITGKVFDSDNNFIGELASSHLGMGLCIFVPVQGKTYYAVCENEKGDSKRFELPLPQKKACVLEASWVRGKLWISAKQDTVNCRDDLFLIAHVRGRICYATQWNPGRKHVSIEKEGLPSGVMHILLINSSLKPVSERLVFVDNMEDIALSNFKTDRPDYGKEI